MMKCSKNTNRPNASWPKDKQNSARSNHLKSPIKKPKPVNSSKKVSTMLETTLAQTSSCTFECEPIKKRRPNRLKKNEVNRWEEAKVEKKKKLKLESRKLKVKPYIVKMTKPTSCSYDLMKMLDDKTLPAHIEGDVNLLKSLMSGCTVNSNVNNEPFPKKVRLEKRNSTKKRPNQEETGFDQTNSTNEVDVTNKTPLEHIKSYNSPDFFVINSSNSCNTEIAKVYRINNSKFLFSMKPGKRLCFVGTFDLELLSGCVEVLGYSANKPLERILTVYSFQGSSHLFIKASSVTSHATTRDTKENPFERLFSLGLPTATSQKICKDTENSVVFVLNRNSNIVQSTVWPMFLENHLSFSLFPHVDLLRKESGHCSSIMEMERSIGCICQENLKDFGYKEFNEVPAWSIIEQNILSKDVFKTVLCGGKSVGKSSLLRYLVNKCLQKWKSVLVVDCDLGQCEFTPPGCVSVTLVDQPLLGPNYSHLKEPLRCVYLGEVDVTKCPESYIKGYKLLIDYAKQEHGNIPWLINTMGFTKGFGVMVACDIIKIVNPSQVIQIESKDRKLNFPQKLEPGYVFSQNTEAFSGSPESLDFNLYVIPSGSESGTAIKSRGLSPAESRNLIILSYLSEMLSADVLNLSQVVPYKIDMDLLELQITNKCILDKAQIAAAMNGNLVALCSMNENDVFPNCLGFGIVRAIDGQTNTIYLITPMPASSLTRVNCLQKGNIALPESLYFNQGGVEGRVPYLAVTSGNATARFAKRDFRSLPATATASGTS